MTKGLLQRPTADHKAAVENLEPVFEAERTGEEVIALYMISQGQSSHEVSKKLGRSKNYVEKLLERIKNEGN